jgi:hypothetical protein
MLKLKAVSRGKFFLRWFNGNRELNFVTAFMFLQDNCIPLKQAELVEYDKTGKIIKKIMINQKVYDEIHPQLVKTCLEILEKGQQN